MLLQFVSPFELFTTFITRKLFDFRVFDHVNFKLVLAWKSLVTDCARKLLLSVESSDMFSDVWIFSEGFLTMRTGENSVFFMNVDMILET